MATKKVHPLKKANSLINVGEYAQAREILRTRGGSDTGFRLMKRLDMAQLKQVKSLLEKNKRSEAVEVLETMKNPTALRWLQTIRKTQKAARRKKVSIVCLMVAVLVMVVLILFGGGSRGTDWDQYKLPSRATLDVFCSVYTRTPAHRCTQWADEVIEAEDENGWEVSFCKDVHLTSDNYHPDRFASCLARAGIYLP